ncbi:hypothetical protein PG985_010278 [Apiospora marii]|uniref:uncharacterized protein n=1 Tax=Apiospora marii TaxID=335849 RepID=UPI0031328B55
MDWPEGFYWPPELERTPTGGSVLEAGSVAEELGRTFQGYKEGRYFLPNDPAEQDRLDFQHAGWMVLTAGNLSFAPMAEEPKRVLDVATGTAIWAVEYAKQHPNATVIGTDLSAIQPANAPSNCEFLKDDAEAEWVFTDPFNYVHLRFIFTCFNDPFKVFRSAFANLKPGGWIEIHDTEAQPQRMDGSTEGMALRRWADAVINGAASMGRDIQVSNRYRDWLIEAGFVDVEERKLMWPCNPWPPHPRLRRAGLWQQTSICEGTLLSPWKLLRAAGLSPVEAQTLIDEAKAEVLDQNNHIYHTAYIVTGRKPILSTINNTAGGA